jgi:hypothetical protein
MIPKSGSRFSEQIMPKRRDALESDSMKLNQTLRFAGLDGSLAQALAMLNEYPISQRCDGDHDATTTGAPAWRS